MSAVYVRHTEDNAVNSQRGVLKDASNRQPAVRAAKKAGVQTRAQRAMASFSFAAAASAVNFAASLSPAACAAACIF